MTKWQSTLTDGRFGTTTTNSRMPQSACGFPASIFRRRAFPGRPCRTGFGRKGVDQDRLAADCMDNSLPNTAPSPCERRCVRDVPHGEPVARPLDPIPRRCARRSNAYLDPWNRDIFPNPSLQGEASQSPWPLIDFAPQAPHVDLHR